MENTRLIEVVKAIPRRGIHELYVSDSEVGEDFREVLRTGELSLGFAEELELLRHEIEDARGSYLDRVSSDVIEKRSYEKELDKYNAINNYI